MPKELVISTYADKGAIVNPTALAVDDQNRIYVAESKRWRKGVEDNRNHRYWLMDDAGLYTLEDREAMYAKWAGSKKPAEFFTTHSESVTRLTDADGDGKAELVAKFAEGFNEALSGTAGGLLVHEGTVFFSCIPSLYALRDENDDGVADKRVEVQRGFGIRVSISGHDMNAAVTGPDGKLYFSIGDRGYNFVSKEGKTFKRVNSGAVFRCYPDGSDMEIYFSTLRNPKELAFDEYGRLFTVDNDMNVDRSRVVYLLEGGEAGWHSGHQLLGDFPVEVGLERGRPNSWFSEGIWKMPFEGKPAHVLPPVAHFTDGPCGLVYNPGTTALPARYDKRFFVFDYRASPNKSGVRAFGVEEMGAGFKMIDGHDFIWGMAGTDVEFGRDGKLYLSDFVGGWAGNDSGYVYTVYDPEKLKDPELARVRELFAKGIDGLATKELYGLMFDEDMRVRQRAQFALAKRGKDGRTAFRKALAQNDNELARLHGLWGLGQQLCDDRGLEKELVKALADDSRYVRGQAAVIVGDHLLKSAVPKLVELLGDSAPQVKAYAAIALGKLRPEKSFAALIELVEKNDNQDLFLRHAGIYGLAGVAKPSQLAKLAEHKSAAVRLAAVLALRRHLAPEVATFLADEDPFIVEEAIRAINDENIVGALPALAAKLEALPELSTLQIYRVLNGNLRVGDAAAVKRILAYAADQKQKVEGRKEALRLLAQWEEPHPIDGTIAVHRPLPKRNIESLLPIIKEGVSELVDQADGNLGGSVARLARQYGVEVGIAGILAQVMDGKAESDVRLAALEQLAAQDVAKGKEICGLLEKDGNADVRRGALAVLASLDAVAGMARIEQVLAKGSLEDKQHAYAVAGTVKSDKAPGLLANAVDAVVGGKLAAGLHLDVLLAAEQRSEEVVKEALKSYNKSLPVDDPLAAWRVSLEGGDAIAGEQLFRTHGSAQCLVCHKLYGEGGEVGPILDKIGARTTRQHLWESIVAPGRDVAPGFGVVTVNLKAGASVTGTFMGSDKKGVKVKLPDGSTKQFERSAIASQTEPLSGMPNMTQLLKPKEVRDIVAYLVTLKKAPKGGGKH
jgi:quinoprotein glucose dehydrogenase